MGRKKRYEKCFDCPPDKEYWVQELKKRQGVFRCKTHIEEYDNQGLNWPMCECGGEWEWLWVHGRKGNIGTVHCPNCFITKVAAEIFTELDLRALGVIK